MDKNLKLAIIGSLIDEGLWNFSVEEFFLNHLKKPYDVMADYNYEPLPELEQYFESLDLKALPVDQLKTLDYYAGCEIVHCVWNLWDGEDDYFDILSLEGIDICSGLEVIDIDILAKVDNLNPLGKMGNLKKVSIVNNGNAEAETSLDPLISLKGLKELNLEGFNINTSSSSYKTIQASVKHSV